MTDREAMIRRLMGPHEWGYRDITDGSFAADDAPFEAAALLRAPTQAEVEAINLDAIARRCARGVRGCATDEQYRELIARIVEALTFASLSPAVGAGWRPIETVPKGDGDEGPDLMLFGPSEHRPGFYIERGRWYRTCFTPQFMSGYGAPTHWQPLPLPPAPEEAK